ncbi:hypothetical protein WA026_022723 [Henosepilachna vigintioctopunctata]|uniref:Uncharacterized protein n=1 Tax=Henosepilachna vigintioctopunctata TaxID=420089 RepID=A0AAW1UGJ2_9CUCU
MEEKIVEYKKQLEELQQKYEKFKEDYTKTTSANEESNQKNKTKNENQNLKDMVARQYTSMNELSEKLEKNYLTYQYRVSSSVL